MLLVKDLLTISILKSFIMRYHIGIVTIIVHTHKPNNITIVLKNT